METVTRKVVKPKLFNKLWCDIRRYYVYLKINIKHYFGVLLTRVYKVTNWITEHVSFSLAKIKHRIAKIKQWISNFPYTYKDFKPKPGYKGSDPLIKGFDL